MDDREELSALIGDIYDAVFAPDHRTDVLDRIADFAGAFAASSRSMPWQILGVPSAVQARRAPAYIGKTQACGPFGELSETG
jgi:hypothetical protein